MFERVRPCKFSPPQLHSPRQSSHWRRSDLKNASFFCAEMGVDEEKGLNFSKVSVDFDAHFSYIFTDVSKSSHLCFYSLTLILHTEQIQMWELVTSLGFRGIGAQKLKAIYVLRTQQFQQVYSQKLVNSALRLHKNKPLCFLHLLLY